MSSEKSFIEGIRFAANYLLENFEGKTNRAEVFSMTLAVLADEKEEILRHEKSAASTDRPIFIAT